MTRHTLTVDKRFCGPPRSANGGYVAGRLATFVGDSACVTLHRPPPLDTLLEVRHAAGGVVELCHAGTILADARTANAVADIPARPGVASAADAAARTFAAEKHRIPGCFVCGPHRKPGDGLRIHPGPLEPHDSNWSGTLAASWAPGDDLGDSDGIVRAEFVWAALDCPTAYACSSPEGMPPILLGRQTVTVLRRPRVREPCVVVCKRQGRERRKFFADALLLDSGGRPLALCNAIWIDVGSTRLAQS